MPRKTDGDKIDELEKIVATLTERIDYVRKELDGAATNISNSINAFADLKTDLAVLKKDVEVLQNWKNDQKKDTDERARRIWAFGPNVLGAVVNVFLSAPVSGLVALLCDSVGNCQF